MKKKGKGIIAMVLLSMLLCSLMGCKTGQSEKSEQDTAKGFSPKYASDTEYKVSVAGSYSNFESLESTIDRFYEYYPKGEITYTYLDDYRNTIVQALAGQEAPDIYMVQPWMYGDEQFKILFEHAEVLSDPKLALSLDCIRSGLQWKIKKGEVLALPIFATSYGMLVNRDIFKKNNLSVPTTFEELKVVCEKLKKAGYASPVMGANTDTTPGIGYAFAYPMFAQNVKEQKAQEDLNQLRPSAGEVMRPALRRLREFVESGDIDVAKCAKEMEDDYNAVILRFFEGDVPMMLCSGDVVSGTKKREGQSQAFSSHPFRYDFYVAPSGDEGGYYMDAISVLFCVNKESDDLAMTNEFIRFMTREEELGLMAEKKRLITPTGDYSLDEVYASLSDFPEERRINFRDVLLYDTAVKQFRAAAYAVVNKEMTVDEAVRGYGRLPAD
ncbi:MAG: carbohydrate ABC transporter substrate-binding protein [Lachnospiraceae bacterium]|nr:carbohydrate ABC transporter substrate-binding protein [Lachnospiraceae bacterium]